MTRRILHIITGLGDGGAQRMLFELLKRRTVEFEHRVLALKDESPWAQPLRSEGIEVSVPTNPSAWLRELNEIRDFAPHWVHSWLYHADAIAVPLARALGSQLVWHLHVSDLDPRGLSSSTRIARASCRLLAKHGPDRIVACSARTASFHEARGYPGPISIIDNGIDLERFKASAKDRESLRAELGFSSEDEVVGCVARYDPQKDIPTLIEAASLSPRIRLVLVGRGMDAANPELERLLAAGGCRERTTLLGVRDDVSKLYSAFDVFTLSSKSEASSLALLEAMASECVPVTTDTGDAARIVGGIGELVATEDARALADGWSKIFSLPRERRKTLGEQARARVASLASIDAMNRRFCALWAGDRHT